MTAEVRLALIAAVLAFAGGLLGSQYSSYLERQRDVEKLNVDWKVRLIEKRIDVFQRCVSARGQIDYFNDLRLELAKDRAKSLDAQAISEDRKHRWEIESTLAGMTQAQYTCIAMASSIF